MDVSGTVVGAVSLGITICNGVLSYCAAWTHQDEDVKTLKSLSESLKDLLQHLDQRVISIGILNPSIARKLDTAIKGCNERCEELVQLSNKYTAGPAIATRKDKTSRLVQKLKFPFEKKTLEELKSIMNAFLGNVELALDVIQIDLSLSTENAVQCLRTENSGRHTTMLGEIQTMGNRVSQSVGIELNKKLPLMEARLSEKICNSASSLEETISKSSDIISQQICNSTSSIESSVNSSSAEILTAIDTLAKSLVLLASSSSENATSRQQLESHLDSVRLHPCASSLFRAGTNRAKCHSQIDVIRNSCSCNSLVGQRVNYSPSSSWWFCRKQTEAFIIHERRCPLWFLSKRVSEYTVNLTLFTRFKLFGTLNLVSSPYAPIFEWHLGTQNLMFTAVVPYGAPAFRLLYQHIELLENGEFDLTRCSRDLMEVFESGQGSPHDILPDGTSLIDYLFWLFPTYYKESRTEILWQLTRDLLSFGAKLDLLSGPYEGSFWQSFQYLVFAEYAPYIATDATRILNNTRYLGLEFLVWLTEHDIEVPQINFYPRLVLWGNRRRQNPWCGFKEIVDTLRQQRNFQLATGCGVLATAVLRRDKSLITKILSEHPDLLRTERNVFRHNAIHLAIGWPDGLEFMLNAADDDFLHQDVRFGGIYGSTPLDYAIAYGCTRSIELLASAETAFDIHWGLRIGTDALDSGISKMVTTLIVDRLQQLLQFGKEHLCTEKFSSLQITGHESFHSKAGILLEQLYEEGIQLPRKFSVIYFPVWKPPHRNPPYKGTAGRLDFWLHNGGGFFHQPDISRHTALAFFQAGLTDIDAESVHITPLMVQDPLHYCFLDGYEATISRYFQVIDFFIDKGCRLSRPISSDHILNSKRSSGNNKSYQAIHRIAYFSWYHAVYFDFCTIESITNLLFSTNWLNIYHNNASDPCICACTIGGCRPISLALKSALNTDNAMNKYSPQYNRPLLWPKNGRWNWGRALDSGYWKLACGLLINVAPLLHRLKGEQLAEDVIRILTFTALGLTHTCCRHDRIDDYRSFSDIKMVHLLDPSEVNEIRDEEAGLKGRLEFLTDVFLKDFRESGKPLSVFMVEDWQEAIVKEIQHKDVLNKSQRQTFCEIGVTIDPNATSTQDLFDEDIDEVFEKSVELFFKERDQAYKKWKAGLSLAAR